MRGVVHFIILIAILIAPGLNAQSNKLFKLLTPKETGIDFKNEIKETEELNVLSYEYFYNGGGVAAGDINQDGLPDLYFTANMKPDKLYLNLGGLKFKDITKQSGIISKTQWKTGVTMADVNNDGLLDIYVCHSGNGDTSSRRNQLYINNGDLTFTEKSKALGLDDPSYSTQAAFFDYDHDGDLDMYLVNHNIKDFKDVEIASLKTNYDSLAGDKLYKNNNGFFSDVSKEAGITGNAISFGLGISISDVNNDGWPDIYISNDYRENDYLYINNQNGTFTDKIHEQLQHISEFSMGNDIADINNDGLLDIITLDMLPEDNRRQKLLQGPENYELHQALVKNGFHHQIMRNMLHLNNGNNTFSEIGQLAGISNTDWSWSALTADFDNDGNKDLFISNGYLRDYTNKDFLKFWGNYNVQKALNKEKINLMELISNMPSTLTQNYIFKNQGNATFTNLTEEWGLSESAVSSGAAYADLDNDGDLEIIVNNLNQPAFVYQNNAQERKDTNYLNVQLLGNDRNKFGLGARLTFFCEGNLQILEQSTVRGFQSSISEILHVGLGNHTLVDSILIKWPSGRRQKLIRIASNQKILLKETDAVNLIEPIISKTFTYLELANNKIEYVHKDEDINDFKRQPLMPFMYSHAGPCLAQGDINNDGLIDLFIGGSKGQPSKLLIQKDDHSFYESSTYILAQDINYTATDAIFFDANNDKHLDLYVVSGLYGDLQESSKFLDDRLYLNDGEGNLIIRKFLPTNTSGKSCARIYDFDQDGDNDIFIGGRIIPGLYPKAPTSYLMRNDGKGNFTDATSEICPSLKELGMVTDAVWTDLNKDGVKDLIIVGEFMPVTVFINSGKSLINKSSEFFDNKYSGLWNTIRADDLDMDGDEDLIIGNLGTNTQLKSKETEPLQLVFKDFDSNGSIDPFICFSIQGKSHPYVTRDELLDQIYPMRKKFTSYKSYADATLADIFSINDLATATTLDASLLETVVFENQNNHFVKLSLPVQAQYAPIYSIQIMDIDRDNRKDILLFGNNSYPRLKLGKLDGNYGMLFLQTSKLKFDYVPQIQSGLQVKGDVRSSAILSIANETQLILGINNGTLCNYKIKSNENKKYTDFSSTSH
jgi:hypothetical protein